MSGRDRFFRTSTATVVKRYRCLICLLNYSEATGDPCYHQKKRQFNHAVYVNLCSTNSQRRTARNLELNLKTVARKLVFLGSQAALTLRADNLAAPPAAVILFDDLETAQHTGLKPLSVVVAATADRRILGLQIAGMPPRKNIKKSIRKYGVRPDLRRFAHETLFKDLILVVAPDAVICSDQHRLYPATVKKYFPHAKYHTFKSRRARAQGQGELKVGDDPLKSINQVFARYRADVNRLLRRTWCTTKRVERLFYHLILFALYHNEMARKNPPPRAPFKI